MKISNPTAGGVWGARQGRGAIGALEPRRPLTHPSLPHQTQPHGVTVAAAPHRGGTGSGDPRSPGEPPHRIPGASELPFPHPALPEHGLIWARFNPLKPFRNSAQK